MFVNHWTSRYGGYAATVPKRNGYADVVRSCVDSLIRGDPRAKILITGDFNDYATDESMTDHLRVREYGERLPRDTLYNLMLPLAFLGYKNKTCKKHEGDTRDYNEYELLVSEIRYN